jgi:hypothetical protein
MVERAKVLSAISSITYRNKMVKKYFLYLVVTVINLHIIKNMDFTDLSFIDMLLLLTAVTLWTVIGLSEWRKHNNG